MLQVLYNIDKTCIFRSGQPTVGDLMPEGLIFSNVHCFQCQFAIIKQHLHVQ